MIEAPAARRADARSVGSLTTIALLLSGAAVVVPLGLIWLGFGVLLPLGRFAGLLWPTTAGFVLPQSSRRAESR